MEFCHLHCHSHYSLMDGLNSPLELMQAAKDVGQTAIAVTDHGTLSSHREWQTAGEITGIKPILGLEAYISPTDRFDRRQVAKRDDNTQVYNHLIVIAKNTEGLKNLQKMSEKAWAEGYYYKPRIDAELLDEYGDGLIVLSGCINGLISRAVEKDDPETVKKWLDFFKNRFGEDFYIETQPHNEASVNKGLLDYADAYGIKPVVTSDCHFARPEDRAIEEAMLILSTSPKAAKGQDYESTKNIENIFERYNVLYPDRPISFEEIDVYVADRADIYSQMVDNDFLRTDIYENTQEIVDKIEGYPFHSGLDLLPTPAIGKNDPDGTLKRLVREGLKERGVFEDENYKARVKEELDIIQSKNFSNYFLIVGDMVRSAKRKGILVGPGRGSAAGSLVCYALGITEVDPIEYDLLFFRFINPERADFPDIDVDFQRTRRSEVKETLRKKYENVANISTFTYFKDKNVVKDAARVYAVPLSDVNAAMKLVETFEEFETLPVTADFRKKYPEVLPLAKALKGRIRSVGIHAAGMVVSNEPIENFAPIETRKDPDEKVKGRVPAIAYDMDAVADIGLIKLDVLGLSTLDVISDALLAIKERHGKEVKLPTHKHELQDEAVFKALSEGKTIGVFQADAAPYTALLKDMRVDTFDDLVASNALVRPGAKNTVGKIFLDRQHGREKVRYAHPILEPILKDTYGVLIYQEQLMQIAVELGGLTMAEADKMRKIIGKKKDVTEFLEFRDKFVEGASKHVSKIVAEQMFHDFEAHSDYSFNLSHAVAYSMLSYWTIWLKINYPLEFMWSLLKNEENKDKVTQFLIESKRIGIKIRLPHVNRSEEYYSIEEDGIRFGLTSIKYISNKVAARLIAARPFNTYVDLLELSRTKFSGVNSRAISALNAIGGAAFDDNPRTGQEPDSFYEYLNIPQFKQFDFPDKLMQLVTNIEDYNEQECFVLQAMVKSIKRGKGWSRVEIVDETGAIGVFHGESTEVKPGESYFLLVASNRIMAFITPKELKEQIDNPLVDYLWKSSDDIGLTVGGGKFIVKNEKRQTKSKAMMATLVCCGYDKELRKVLVFPKSFGITYGKLKEGTIASINVKRLEDGGFALQKIG